MKKLTKKIKEALKEMVEYKCERCGKKTKELEPHRIHRGYAGGEYVPRNILMLCKKCHQEIHAGEFL